MAVSLGQQGANVRFDIFAIHNASGVRGRDASFLVDEESVGQVRETEGLHGGFAAEKHAVGHVMLKQEGLQNTPAAFVNRDSDYREMLRGICLLELREPGDFFFTTRAPGGPEIEKDHFTAIVLEGSHFAIRVLQMEFGSGFAVPGCLEHSADRGEIGAGYKAGG